MGHIYRSDRRMLDVGESRHSAGKQHHNGHSATMKSPMTANCNGPVTEEQDAAQAALDGLRTRVAADGPIAPTPVADDAIRRAARSDLDAQWGPES
jgi:hypothetical protein